MQEETTAPEDFKGSKIGEALRRAYRLGRELTPSAISREIGVSRKTVWQWLKVGHIPYVSHQRLVHKFLEDRGLI